MVDMASTVRDLDEFQVLLDGITGPERRVDLKTLNNTPENEGIGEILANVRRNLECGRLDKALGVSLAQRIDSILRDMEALPLAVGNACPTGDDLEMVDNFLDDGDYFLEKLAETIFDSIEADNAADYYNASCTYDEGRAEKIWGMLKLTPGFGPILLRFSLALRNEISEENMVVYTQKAIAELRAAFSNAPTKYLSKKNVVLFLMNRLKRGVSRKFEELLIREVRNGLPLTKGGKRLEKPEVFEKALGLAQNFAQMNEGMYLAMIRNKLGQAQTANPGKAEPFFRSREGVPSEGIQNNFGYVYLNADQFSNDGFDSDDTGIMRFNYMGETYFAVPAGLYMDTVNPNEFAEAMRNLKELADESPGTPVAEYYDLLRQYYELPVEADLQNEEFAREYHRICYAAERAWVAYVKYAGEHRLPFIHIHPFEKYETTSTRDHDLAVGVVNHLETELYLEAKNRFIANAKAFLERKGITAKYPEMAAKTMELLNSAAILSLGARMQSQLDGTIAQNIPNEEPGRRGGVAVLCDTAFAQRQLESSRGEALKMADAVGGLEEKYAVDINDFDTFILHYVLEVLSHELNHNMYKGGKQVYDGDGLGLAIQLVEEAKATNGLALAFEDPENLTDEDIAKLRKALPLMLPWSIFRLKKELRAEHTSHEYFREGAVMLDHALKSGLLKVVHAELDEVGEPVVSTEEFDDNRGFEFLRYNLGERQIRDYVARCARFEERLAPIYHQTQGFEGQLAKGTKVPDITDIDVWQALSRECYLEERRALMLAKGPNNPDVMAIDLALEKLVEPKDENIPAIVRALIRNASFEQPGRMRAEVAMLYHLDPKSPEVDEKIASLRAKLKESHPQIYGMKEVA